MARSLTKKAKAPKPRALNRNSEVAKLVEAKHIGLETVDWANINPFQFKNCLRDTLRHYNHFFENKDHYNWALQWAKKHYLNLVKIIQAAPEWAVSPTVGGLCKIMLNGAKLPTKNYEWVVEQLENLPIKKQTSEVFDRKSPAELVKENTSDFIGFVEIELDNNNFEFNVYDELKKIEAAGVTAKKTIEYYQPLQKELEDALNKVDEQLVEAYSKIPLKDKKQKLQLLSNIIEGCNKFLGVKRATRKIRAKKAKPVESKFIKFPYQKESNEFQIASVNPINIVGATSVFLFNTKTKHMVYLKAIDEKGFDVKGSTILRVDDENSFKKVVRKATDISSNVQKTKTGILKYMLDIKTVKSTASSRCNVDTIVLKCFK